MALFFTFWQWKVVRRERATEDKDDQWAYRIMAKIFFIEWGAVGMALSFHHGFWFNLWIPLLAVWSLDKITLDAFRLIYPEPIRSEAFGWRKTLERTIGVPFKALAKSGPPSRQPVTAPAEIKPV